MSWENCLTYACLSDSIFNLFFYGTYSKWNVSVKRKWKADISCYEKQKSSTFSLIVWGRGRGFWIKITKCHLSLAPPLWQRNDCIPKFKEQSENLGSCLGFFFKDFRKGIFKILGGEKMEGLSNLSFYFLTGCSYRYAGIYL